MVFPLVMYGYESWTIKKAEHQRIDTFELQCWRRFLRVTWTARSSNNSVLKDINPRDSWRAPKAFRQHIAVEMAKRCLIEATNRCGGEIK